MELITQKKQNELIDNLNQQKINCWLEIHEMRNKITQSKNNEKEKVLMLLEVLAEQIEKYNGVVTRKINKVKSIGTID